MQQKMYSIRDARAEVFGAPYYALTAGMAERNFTQLVNDEKSQLNMFPDDFDLYEVGVYDDQDGKGQFWDTPRHIIKAVQVLQKKN